MVASGRTPPRPPPATRRKGLSRSIDPEPIPGTRVRSSTLPKGPFSSRSCTIRAALAAPTPGSRSRSSSPATLGSIVSPGSKGRLLRSFSSIAESPAATRLSAMESRPSSGASAGGGATRKRINAAAPRSRAARVMLFRSLSVTHGLRCVSTRRAGQSGRCGQTACTRRAGTSMAGWDYRADDSRSEVSRNRPNMLSWNWVEPARSPTKERRSR